MFRNKKKLNRVCEALKVSDVDDAVKSITYLITVADAAELQRQKVTKEVVEERALHNFLLNSLIDIADGLTDTLNDWAERATT